MNIKSKINMKIAVISAALVLLLTVGVGVALSYIGYETPPLPNSFTPGVVSCAVNESFSGQVKSDVSVRNTGNVPAYIRACLVITWQSDDAELYARAPVEGDNYVITYGDSRWMKGDDGFWYYIDAVMPGADTSMLIASVAPAGEAPEGYSLSVEIIATAIQTEPVSTVEDAWGVTVLNGKIMP
ncbi:MAG: hypothetical protein E7619_06205 [Ruminococcaceae bacterium]|nr:hypothetical protein [Oscillospiraceae bacterium]